MVPIDHRPSWKVGKNPFHAGLTKMALIKNANNSNASMNGSGGHANQHMDNMYGNPQQMNMNMNSNSYMNNTTNMNMNMGMQQQQQQIPMNMGMNNMQQFPNMQIQQQTLYAYGEHEDVQGVVHLTLPPGRKIEHGGVKVQFVGRVDMVSRVHDHSMNWHCISCIHISLCITYFY